MRQRVNGGIQQMVQLRPWYTTSFVQASENSWWPHSTTAMRLSRCHSTHTLQSTSNDDDNDDDDAFTSLHRHLVLVRRHDCRRRVGLVTPSARTAAWVIVLCLKPSITARSIYNDWWVEINSCFIVPIVFSLAASRIYPYILSGAAFFTLSHYVFRIWTSRYSVWSGSINWFCRILPVRFMCG